MTKSEMIKHISSEANVTNKVAEAVMDAYEKFVLGVLITEREEKVPLPGLGSFSVKHVAKRSGIAALAGGKTWIKPEHDEIQFKLSKSIKEL